jgi:hypothetical protein
MGLKCKASKVCHLYDLFISVFDYRSRFDDGWIFVVCATPPQTALDTAVLLVVVNGFTFTVCSHEIMQILTGKRM